MAGSARHPGPSFRDVVAGPSSSAPGQVSYENGSFLGSPALFISDEDMVSLAKPFELTLVGRFRVPRPPLDAIRIFVNRLKFAGEVKVIVHDNLHVFFRFSVGSDYNRFFLLRFYNVFWVIMKDIKWSPFFDFGYEIPIVPLWIRFPELRLHLFDKTSLMYLGKSFGVPLSVDSMTAGCGRSPVARVLVEVDVSKPIPDRVWIGSRESGAFQAVVVENAPSYCCRCRNFGHVDSHCPLDLALVIHSGVVEGSAASSNPPGGVDQPVPDSHVDGPPLDGASQNIVFLILPNGEISTCQEASIPSWNLCVEGAGDRFPGHAAGPDMACGMPSGGGVLPEVPAPPRVEPAAAGGAATLVLGDGCAGPPGVEVVSGDVLLVDEFGKELELDSSESAVLEDLPSFGGDGVNSACPGFPTMGITTRSKSRASGGLYSGRGDGGNSGGKSKKKKRKNKYDHAMAVALEALFKPPDYYG